MIAQRYGTVPVVRRTGGLNDTVRHGETGFLFNDANAQGLLWAAGEAIDAWRGAQWDALRTRCMALDWSWTRSAGEYEALYTLARGG
jgi:starch synthase